jgi:hypothetical protein
MASGKKASSKAKGKKASSKGKSLPQNVQKLLTKLGSDPDVLGSFIQNPDSVIKKNRIDRATADSIKNLLAVEVARRLVVYDSSMHIHWVPGSDF